MYMKAGIFSIYLALIATGFSAWKYWLAARAENGEQKTRHQKQGRIGFYVSVAILSLSSFYLLFLILTHHFEVSYIYRYTSRDLKLGYLISALWAGQEGSILFWAWSLSIMGLLFRRTAGVLENRAMFFINLIQAAFLIILIKASPFVLLPQVPVDGAGLNPLLQNFWMVIHPPILFLGYAAAAIPFAIALAALQNHDFDRWGKLALPWTLFTSVTLGAGIIIGGFWAYEVLGWGGYWGWDPVENSSLIAWLVIISLLHGLLITKRTGALQKTNLSLAILSFVLVLYATFLTRSGVLADFSVHSFQDLGINSLLILFMASSFLAGFVLLYLNRGQVPFRKISFDSLSKENVLLVTIILFLASAFFILIGTSSPLITGLLGKPSQANISFYNRINLPLGIVMALILFFVPFLKWKEMQLNIMAKRLLIPSLVGAVTFIASILVQIQNWQFILFLTFSTMALTSNLIVFVKRSREKIDSVSAPLAHIGVALMFMGIVLSAYFSQEQRVIMTKDQPVKALGVELTYVDNFSSPDGKDGLIIDVREDGKTYKARPKIYMNNYMNNMMHEPDIKRGLVTDLYLSPVQLMSKKPETQQFSMTMIKGEKKTWQGYEVEFRGFGMSNHQSSGEMRVAAKLVLRKDGTEIEADPAIVMTTKGSTAVPFEFASDSLGKTSIVLAGVNADAKSIRLIFESQNIKNESAPQPQVVMEVSKKTFMSVLWLGTILLILGMIVGAQKRFKEVGSSLN